MWMNAFNPLSRDVKSWLSSTIRIIQVWMLKNTSISKALSKLQTVFHRIQYGQV